MALPTLETSTVTVVEFDYGSPVVPVISGVKSQHKPLETLTRFSMNQKEKER